MPSAEPLPYNREVSDSADSLHLANGLLGDLFEKKRRQFSTQVDNSVINITLQFRDGPIAGRLEQVLND